MDQTKKKSSRFLNAFQQSNDEQRSKRVIIRHLWGAAGVCCFGLGALGAILPLLPTTPFILLAALCFARSSKKLDSWFRETKLYKTVFEGLLTRRAMTLSAKLKLLIPITLLLGVSFVLMSEFMLGRIIVATIFIGHIVYFGFMVKTEKPESPMQSVLSSQSALLGHSAVQED